MLTRSIRLTSSRSSPEPRCFCSSSQKLVSSTRLQRRSYNRLLPNPKARISYRYINKLVHAIRDMLTIKQACLNAPEPASDNQNGVEGEEAGNSPEDVAHVQPPQQPPSMPRNGGIPAYGGGLTPEQQQQMMYQQYVSQQHGVAASYQMPPQVC